MPEIVEAPATEPVVPPSHDVTPEPPASIADHAAAFGPTRETAERETERGPANTGQFASPSAEAKHRAQSQRATAEDVAEINKLTKDLRAKEAELAKVDPDSASGGSRIQSLRQRIRGIEAALAEKQPKPAAAAPQPTRATAPVSGDTFTEPLPTLEQFANEPDPYEAYLLAKFGHTQRKEAWESKQADANKAADAERQALVSGHQARMEAFAKVTPDFDAVTKAFLGQEIPTLLVQSLIRDDNGPQHVYYLAQHPELVDELFLQTAHQPVTDAHVAVVQRRLKQHAQAAPTGSAAVARAPYSPPRPPNPVRTGPLKTADDPPDEAASISDHAKYFGPKRR